MTCADTLVAEHSSYTPKEVAALERCHIETIYRALRAGCLRGYRLRGSAGKWRISGSALAEWRGEP
jgi:excisionase family DNA binding protein